MAMASFLREAGSREQKLVYNSFRHYTSILNFLKYFKNIDCMVLPHSFRYAYPWWREKEIVSEERRAQGLCPLTPEETTLILQALGFDKDTQIYIASGEIYGSERRLAALRAVYPRIVSLLLFVFLLLVI